MYDDVLAIVRKHLTRFTWLYVLIFTASFFALSQFATPNLVDRDSHYHIKYAYLMRTEGLFLRQRWLSCTILTNQLLDHHFLYHFLLIPFTFCDLRLGAKIASVVFETLMTFVFYLVLRRRNAPYGGFWVLVLISSSYPFLYRMSMTRVQHASLTLLLILFVFFVSERRWWILVLSAAYVWLHVAASVYGVLLACLYALAGFLIDRKARVLAATYAVCGWIAGYLINPSFPANVRFGLKSMLHKLTPEYSVHVGGEWYAYRTDSMLSSCGIAFVALFAGVVMIAIAGKKIKQDTLFAFLISTLFFVATMKAKRFVEYWPAFSVLFSALATRDYLLSEAGEEMIRALGRWRSLLATLIFLIVIYGCARNYKNMVEDIINSCPRTERYGPAARWLALHTQEGETIFNTRWDDFPEFFYHNSKDAFVVGLDPGYMDMKDHALYELWRSINHGDVQNPSQVIRSRFRSRFIFTDNDNNRLISQLTRSPNAQKVFGDKDCLIFEVK